MGRSNFQAPTCEERAVAATAANPRPKVRVMASVSLCLRFQANRETASKKLSAHTTAAAAASTGENRAKKRKKGKRRKATGTSNTRG